MPNTKLRTSNLLGLLAILFFMLLLPLLPLHPLDVAITVLDGDLGIPLEGAIIRTASGEEFHCDETGRALIQMPDSGGLVLIAYPGYENSRLFIPPAGNAASEEPLRITATLSLGAVLESRELVLEAESPRDMARAESGRSVALGAEDLWNRAEIGLIEDVMSSVKLLPGVGYTGFFSALPSIRGGDPGDLIASLDGYYIDEPYHWGGGFSIFDPKMVESARLSHGVFSARYGHTISGLLEIQSKRPNPQMPELDVGVSTSAASANLSLPLNKKGGVLAMGKFTYYDPFVRSVQGLSSLVDNETLDMVNQVTTPPYIRSGIIAAGYSFTPDMDLFITGFIATDGVGVDFKSDYAEDGISGRNSMVFDWVNNQGYVNALFTWTPHRALLVRSSAGGGFTDSKAKGTIRDNLMVPYSENFIDLFGPFPWGTSYTLDEEISSLYTQRYADALGRIDLDWDVLGLFIIAAGAEARYNRWAETREFSMPYEESATLFLGGSAVPGFIRYPAAYRMRVENQGISSAGYILGEYASPLERFTGEAGLRVDHLYFIGKDALTHREYAIQTLPVVNPRLNLNYRILQDVGALESLTIALGSGLFSTIGENITHIESNYGIADFELKPTRAWTTLVGVQCFFMEKISLSIEGYYKRIFDRGYIALMEISPGSMETKFCFDGEGHVWGLDLMLRKLESRYWDGWLSYSFTYARYRDPSMPRSDLSVDGAMGANRGSGWYWPEFHRFHNLNLVLNLKPMQQFHIGFRFGAASGQPISQIGKISSYPVHIVDPASPQYGMIIEKYSRSEVYSDEKRAGWSLPLDLKFSFFPLHRNSRVLSEVYLGIENLLVLVYNPTTNTTFNPYTGKEDAGSVEAVYDLPIPMVSFGIKWSF